MADFWWRPVNALLWIGRRCVDALALLFFAGVIAIVFIFVLPVIGIATMVVLVLAAAVGGVTIERTRGDVE